MAKPKQPTKRIGLKRGPPSKFTEEFADEICRRIALGESMRSVCRDPLMPSFDSVLSWLREERGEFLAKYMRARALQAHVWIDDMRELSMSDPERHPLTGAMDTASVTHIRNQVATLQWLAMKLNPKKYGDKVGVEQSGSISLRVVTGVPQADPSA